MKLIVGLVGLLGATAAYASENPAAPADPADHAGETYVVTGSRLPASQLPQLVSVGGFCQSARGMIDMKRVLYLENRSIEVDGPLGPIRWTLQGDEVRREMTDARGATAASLWVPGEVIEEGEPVPDLALKFAMVDGVLAVYWRETYQNRIYRQGLLKVQGARLAIWCEGSAGITSSPPITHIPLAPLE